MKRQGMSEYQNRTIPDEKVANLMKWKLIERWRNEVLGMMEIEPAGILTEN